MVVNSEDVMNIMGGMENSSGIKLNDHKRKLKNRFEICKKLGQGTYGKVQLGINKETQERVAIKTIKKSKIETEADLIRIRREIQIMSSVQHPNIIHIYEVFENKEKMVLVMEMANGGELYDFLSDKKCLEEHEARRIFRQISTAVFYCHKHKICHRDLKLENILLDENGSAKIADFGLSNVFGGESLLNTFCGSPLYASPEIVKGSPYEGPEVDCWSLGVLLYTLVYGAMPFDGSNFKRLVRQITTGDYYEPKDASRASSLIRSMLTVQPEMRAKIEDICSHWWVNETYPQSCLTEAEYLASLTPVRLDLLLGVSPCPKIKETPKIGQMEKPLSIEEIDNEDKAEMKHLEDIPKLPPGSMNGYENSETRIESPQPEKRLSPPPSDKEAFSNEVASDSGVMVESMNEIDEQKSNLDNSGTSILELENTPSQNIPTTISLIQEPEPPSIPPSHPPPPPICEKIPSPKPESIKEVIQLPSEPIPINGLIKGEPPAHDPPMIINDEQVLEEQIRNKSPTPPPTPPPLPPPPPVPSTTTTTPLSPTLKEKLKVNIQPLVTEPSQTSSTSSPSPEEREVKDKVKDTLDSPKTSTPEKRDNRDSKVIKAAQYWNNYIGDVISKNKSPDTTKTQPKPKKIIAAGVGPKGMNELKTAFENGKDTLEKRPSRKSSIGGCNPGLKVTDAKNVFEIKAQQPPTPVIYRRNSGAKDGAKAKWTKPKPRPTTPGLENEIALQQIKILQGEPQEIQQPLEMSRQEIKSPETVEPPKPKKEPAPVSIETMPQNDKGQAVEVDTPSPLTPPVSTISPTKEMSKLSPLSPESTQEISHEPLGGKVITKTQDISGDSPLVSAVAEPKHAHQKPEPPQNTLLISTNITQPIQEPLLTTAPVASPKAKPILRQVKSLDTPSNIEPKPSLPPLIINNEIKKPLDSEGKTFSPSIKTDECSKSNDTQKTSVVGIKPRPSKLNKPKAVQHFENKINSIQPTVVVGKKEGEIKASDKGIESPKVPNVLPETPTSTSSSHQGSTSCSSPTIQVVENRIGLSPLVIDNNTSSINFENSLKMIGSSVSQPTPVPYSSPPPISKPPPPPPCASGTILQTPSQIQAPLLKNNTTEKYVPISLEKDTPSNESKTVYHIPLQVESPSICEDKRGAGNYYPSNSLTRRGRWGSRKKRMSTGYSDSSMSDDDGSFFQYPSGIGLQKQISLGKHGLETAPMFRLRKTRPPFTLQREPSFSSDGEDELEDDGFREMTAENLFSTLLTRVKSLTRRIHDEHEEHINKWHQNQRIVNHPLNPGDTHARLERSALRNSIKRLPMNKRPTYDDTPLPSTIPSENLDLACGVSVTSKQRTRPGYLPHPNVERIIPINLVNSHEKFDFLHSSSPPIRRISEIGGEMPFGDDDRQRRVSRFLRPDFYDTPKEDSIYAKMKEMEEADKKKSRFLKKIQARNASESCDVLSPLSSLGSNQDDYGPLISASPSSSNGEGCEPIQLRKTRGELDNISEEESHVLSSGRRPPVLMRGLSDSLARPSSSSSNYGIEQLPQQTPLSSTKDNLSKLISRRSISSELFGDDFLHHPRSITRRSISKDLHDAAEDLRLRSSAWNEFDSTPRSSSGRSPRATSNTINRSEWRRTSVPERGKDFKTLPRNYVKFD